MEAEGPPVLVTYGGLLGKARAPVVVHDGQVVYLEPSPAPVPPDEGNEDPAPTPTPAYAKTGALDDLLSS